MSQDHLFSAIKRPRESVANPNIYGSSIPQPASTVKRNPSLAGRPSIAGNPRLSMAPGRTGLPRSSSGGDLAGMGGNPGFSSSSANKFSSRKSMLPPSSSAPPPSARRSSMYSAGRQSTIGGGATPGGRDSFMTSSMQTFNEDPRPLKTVACRQRMAQQIGEYLTNNGFEMDMKHSLTNKSLVSPTQRDFQTIFQWLYQRLDPLYRFTKVENEVLPLLKVLRYPYPHTITKSQLSAVGSQNAWPQFLGMLHWMMELAQITDHVISGEYDDVADELGIDISTQRIAFRYTTRCYNAWIMEIDDHSEFEAEMAQAFESRNVGVEEQLSLLEAENAELKRELEELELAGKPLEKQLESQKTLQSDISKFDVYIKASAQRMAKLKDVVVKIRAELEKANQKNSDLQEQKHNLQAQVDAQGLSPADIDRMNSDREKLNTQLSSIGQKLFEAATTLADRESKAQSHLEALERAVSRYKALAYKIGISPATARNADGKDYDLHITPLQKMRAAAAADPDSGLGESASLLVDAQTGWQPTQLLNLDLIGQVKPRLHRLFSEITQQIDAAHDEISNRQDYFEKIAEAFADKKDELDTLEAKLQSINNEHHELKETIQSITNASNAELERQQSQLQTLRVSAEKGLLDVNQKLQAITVECDQFYRDQNELRAQLHAQTKMIVEGVVDFKVHVQQSLEGYEEAVERELEEFLVGEKRVGGVGFSGEAEPMNLD